MPLRLDVRPLKMMVTEKLDLTQESHAERRKGSSHSRTACQSSLQDRLEVVVMGRTMS